MELLNSVNPRFPPPNGFQRRRLTGLGLLGIAGYAVHAGYHLATGNPQEILWTCHVSALAVGVGLLARSPLCNAVGLLAVLIGLPFWILYLIGGEPFLITSPLTHVLGPVLGVIGARSMGLPRRAWWVALIYVAALTGLSRLIGPAEANVNFAFGPMAGWDFFHVSLAMHLTGLMILWAGGLFLVQCLLLWALQFRFYGPFVSADRRMK